MPCKFNWFFVCNPKNFFKSKIFSIFYKNLHTERNLPVTANISSKIAIIFVLFEKYLDTLVTSLVGTGKFFCVYVKRLRNIFWRFYNQFVHLFFRVLKFVNKNGNLNHPHNFRALKIKSIRNLKRLQFGALKFGKFLNFSEILNFIVFKIKIFQIFKNLTLLNLCAENFSSIRLCFFIIERIELINFQIRVL